MPRRNSISGEGKYSEKPNIAEAESGVPRKKGTGTRFVRGGGKKCYGFAAKRFTFPQEYNIALADAIHEIYMVQHASAIFIIE